MVTLAVLLVELGIGLATFNSWRGASGSAQSSLAVALVDLGDKTQEVRLEHHVASSCSCLKTLKTGEDQGGSSVEINKNQ